ncbi:hypothetical protein ACFSUJ_11990 [Streptomyces lusitanus]|uniref:Secreted protein n=1 Tax=Streptomyces lusitanus TaxID=68232 RepID=A0ABU3JP38_9ACTN|nr:hypothetical protein [Streptomyces lusitanus]
MSATAASAADWLRAGGIGAGAWVVLAVLVKAAADRPAPPRPEAPAIEAPPRPAYPPSTGRHAGDAAPDETRLLAAPAAPVSLRKRQPAWT